LVDAAEAAKGAPLSTRNPEVKDVKDEEKEKEGGEKEKKEASKEKDPKKEDSKDKEKKEDGKDAVQKKDSRETKVKVTKGEEKEDHLHKKEEHKDGKGAAGPSSPPPSTSSSLSSASPSTNSSSSSSPTSAHPHSPPFPNNSTPTRLPASSHNAVAIPAHPSIVFTPSSRKLNELDNIALFTVFDGHGGAQCCDYLEANFHHFLFNQKEVLNLFPSPFFSFLCVM